MAWFANAMLALLIAGGVIVVGLFGLVVWLMRRK